MASFFGEKKKFLQKSFLPSLDSYGTCAEDYSMFIQKNTFEYLYGFSLCLFIEFSFICAIKIFYVFPNVKRIILKIYLKKVNLLNENISTIFTIFFVKNRNHQKYFDECFWFIKQNYCCHT